MLDRRVDRARLQRTEHRVSAQLAPGRRMRTGQLPDLARRGGSEPARDSDTGGGALAGGAGRGSFLGLDEWEDDLAPEASEQPAATSEERAGLGSPIGIDFSAPVPATAATGVRAASAPLPHGEAIQRAFGHHDVSGVRAAVGGPAADAALAIGARAYAIGDRVGFAAAPDLHTAAHEAAHVVQQRAGVSLEGGAGQVGDRYEQHADRVAAAVEAGQSAEAILDEIPRGGRAATGVQRLSDESGPLVDAAEYLRHNQLEAKSEIGRALRSVAWPEPHPRMGWRDRAGFVQALLEALDGFVHTFDRPDSIDKLVHPARALATVDALRPTTGDEAGGAIGPTTWRPQVGLALARLLEESMDDSLARLGPRWLAAAERAGQAEGAWVTVEYSSLITSHPVDRVVGRAMCAPGVFTVRAGAAEDAPTELRPVVLSWQGARSPRLWNWVRALEPADASAEEVAAQLFAGCVRGEAAPFRAYRIVGASPLFAVPPEWALGFAEARAHAPASGEEPTDAPLATIAASELADDIALAQSDDERAALDGARQGASESELLDLLADSSAQATAIAGALAPWGLSAAVGAALGWIHRKELELATMDDAARHRWAPVLREQKANLHRIGGAVVAVDGAAGSMATEDRTGAGGAPLRDILATYAEAAATSHLVDTCRELIARAARQQTRLPLRALAASSDALGASVSMLADATGPGDQRACELRASAAGVDRETQVLASKLMSGAAVAPGELDDLMLDAGELALDARLSTLDAELGALERAADQAGDGLAAEIAALASPEFRNITVVTTYVRDRLAWIRQHRANHIRAWSIATPADLPPDQAAATSRRHRQDALSAARDELARVARNQDLATFLRRGAALVDAQAFRTACLKVAALIGVSVAGGIAGAAFGRFVGGMLASSPAIAGLARSGAGLLVETAITSEGQVALFGGSRRDAYLENLLAGGASMGLSALFARSSRQLAAEAGALAPFARGADELATLEARGWAHAAAAGGGEMLVDFSLGYAARLVAGAKSDPPPDTVKEWLLEAASIGLGRLIAGGVHARIDSLRRLTAAGLPEAQPLLLGAETLAADADALAKSPDPAHALELLARRRELAARELDVIDALAKQPDRLAAAGVERSELGPMRRERLAELAASDDPALATLPLHLAGLEELVPGALWKGSPDDIERALRAVRSTTPSATIVHDPASGRWRLALGDLSLVIHERRPPGPDRDALTRHLLDLDPIEGPRLLLDYGDDVFAYLRVEPLTTIEELAKALKRRHERVRHQVPGLVAGITGPPAGWIFRNFAGDVDVDTQGRRSIEHDIWAPDETHGVFRRGYDPATRQINLDVAFTIDNGRPKGLPRMVAKQGDAPELVPGKGTPTLQYVTLYQMKLLGVPMGDASGPPGVETVHMSDIQNLETIVHLHYLRENVGGDLSSLIVHTASVEYADTTVSQLGYERSENPTVTVRNESPIGEIFAFQARGNSTRISQHDELLARYGYTRDTPMLWGFDIDFPVRPRR